MLSFVACNANNKKQMNPKRKNKEKNNIFLNKMKILTNIFCLILPFTAAAPTKHYS